MKLTFKNKALFFMIPFLIFISTVYTFEAIQTEKGIMKSEIIKRSEVITTLATKTGELPILSGNQELLKNAVSFLRGISEVAFVSFYDRQMRLLIHDGIAVPKPQQALTSDSAVTFFEKQDFFDFYAPVFTMRAKEDIDMFQSEGSPSQIKEIIGWVRIGFSKSAMKQAEKDIVSKGLMLAVIFATLSGIVVSVLINIATRPLTLLFSAVKKIREGEYPEVEIISSSDEIGELSVEFNRMSRAIKDRELKLVESEKKVRELFERVEHAIFRLDKDGNIIETNRKFDEICGGANRFCGLFAADMEGLRLQKTISEGLRSSEERIMGSDGNELIVIMSVYPEFDEQGNIKGFDGYFVDITEKKRLEETLFHTQKLDSLGMLAGGIAHDFNNILTGVVGYSSLLKKVVPETDKIYRYADAIEKSAIRAANLTQQLLGFARKGKYIMEKFSLNDTIKELVGFLRETFDRSVTIVLDSEPNLPPVEGDSNQIYQAILNLCINARDAMPEGGRLYIKTEFYLLHDRKVTDFFQIPPGEYVKISVTDTGGGMTSDVKKKIFEPFYTTKGIGKGTGLGLAMVYGIIKNHGGYINVYSEPGLGTTIRIYLPKTDGTMSADEKRRGNIMDERPKRGTILIIDDEEVVRELGKDILEAYDYKVLLAVHGNEGLRVFNENKDVIDLVILDMVMPEKGGRQTFREIRSIKPDTKILLCSGYGQEQYFHELFEAGAAGFLQKPFQHTELLSSVEEAMRR